ncbi:MAG: GntR family transcriptional regulator [Candidatus Atribacteria bacterium]|nr:GntR family transcriptional regulator [Candidatus Atribacteria bacterium]
MRNKNTIYKGLKKEIMSGKLLPGSNLVEREISNEYSISRTPVREVLWRLASDGLLEQESTGGYIVKKISLEEIFNIFQTREAIEGMAARLACQKGDDNFFSNIKELGERIKEIDIEKKSQEGVFFGRKLHDLIIATANNVFLLEIYNKLRDLAALTRNITKKSVLIEKKSQESHLLIINSLEEKDEEKSEYYMREHLRITCRMMVDCFYPNLFK